MNQLVEASVAFPTVVLTGILGLALLYWVTVIIGALDVDLFGGDIDLDGAADGALDGVAEGALDGAAEGVDGALDGVDGVEVDAGALGGLSALAGLRTLRKVPITISVSAVVFIAWTINITTTILAGDAGLLTGTPLVLAGFALGVLVAPPLGSLAVRPLVPLFVTVEAKRNKDYVGQTCEISTGRVDADFGVAEFADDGPVLKIQVRCDQADNGLARGDQALIIDYDEARHAFIVEAMQHVIHEPGDA